MKIKTFNWTAIIISIVVPAVIFPFVTTPSFALYKNPQTFPCIIVAHITMLGMGICAAYFESKRFNKCDE